MEQYINKSALVAEIEKELNTTKKYSTEYVNGKKYTLKKVLSFLDTLEVKRVDLDSEITLWANAIPGIRLDDVERLATYFFELGLKAQKGE